jgi:tRNA-modifying protein YgfZ
LLTELGGGDLIGRSINDFELITIDRISVKIAVGSGLSLPGYQLIFDAIHLDKLTQKIVELGAASLTASDWERLRIEQGRPAPDRELTEDYNPLEVGLWQTISFSKGCYIGQETIARLNTYKGIKQYLWGIKFDTEIAIGTPLTIDEDKIGILTSIIKTDTGWQGLAYIKSKAGGVGLKVNAANAIGEIIDLPFVSHEYPA